MNRRAFWPIIRKDIEEGKSLNKISRETGISKSTLYEHYKKIKGRKIPLVKIEKVSEDIVGEIMGAFAGDGGFQTDHYYHYNIRIHLSPDEEEYATTLSNRMTKLFSKKPIRWIKSTGTNIILSYNSRKIYEFLKDYLAWEEDKTATIRLKQNISDYSKKFLIGFLRGCLDTDGYVHGRGYTSFSTICKDLAEQISQALNVLHVENYTTVYYSKWRPLYTVRVKKGRAIGLLKILKPSNPKRRY